MSGMDDYSFSVRGGMGSGAKGAKVTSSGLELRKATVHKFTGKALVVAEPGYGTTRGMATQTVYVPAHYSVWRVNDILAHEDGGGADLEVTHVVSFPKR